MTTADVMDTPELNSSAEGTTVMDTDTVVDVSPNLDYSVPFGDGSPEFSEARMFHTNRGSEWVDSQLDLDGRIRQLFLTLTEYSAEMMEAGKCTESDLTAAYRQINHLRKKVEEVTTSWQEYKRYWNGQTDLLASQASNDKEMIDKLCLSLDLLRN